MSHSHFQSPTTLLTRQQLSVSPPADYESTVKRKRSSTISKNERKKVSRACDACKEKKVRCAGTQPCPRCIKQRLQCSYNKAHKRGKPSPPEPGIPIVEILESSNVRLSSPLAQRSGFLQEQRNEPTPAVSLDAMEPVQDLRRSTRSSQEADGVRFEEDYIGPTSGIAFLHRAQKRFQQDYEAVKSKSSEAKGSYKTPVFSFGDGWIPEISDLEFSLPDRAVAQGLLNRYFDFAMPTYRFLNRPAVEIWLERMFKATDPGQLMSNAKKAIVLLIMATAKLYNENATDITSVHQNLQAEESNILFAEAERLLSDETGPVRIESVQARLAQCIHLLASSRINHAWYVFGTATQMISALGLHRKPLTNKRAALMPLDINMDCRKQVFWSAYTLDRYLSVILGRPRIFRDEDIDQDLPHSSDEPSCQYTPSTKILQSVSDAPRFHARLARILGSISNDLYSNRNAEVEWIDSSERWTRELKEWKDSLPAFLDPSKVDPSMLIPIYQRQSTVLRLAYAHAMILANRPALLSSFADLSRRQGIPLGEATGSLKECVDAALVVVTTVDGLVEVGQMRKAFWFTHYISFCAISALYVYTIQQCLSRQTLDVATRTSDTTLHDTRHFDAAARCQESIENTTTKTSPFRRYNIILDELKKEVMQHLQMRPIHEDTAQHRAIQNSQNYAGTSDPSRIMDSSGGTPITTPVEVVAQLSQNISNPENVQIFAQINQINQTTYPSVTASIPPEFTNMNIAAPSALSDSMVLELEAFGARGDMMGWSEFDSCAINWPEGLDIFENAI